MSTLDVGCAKTNNCLSVCLSVCLSLRFRGAGAEACFFV